MSPTKQLSRIPFSRLSIPLAILVAWICLECIAVRLLHADLKPILPNRTVRLWLLDFPPVFISIALALWFRHRLEGGGIRSLLVRTGLLTVHRRQLGVALLCVIAFTAWHLTKYRAVLGSAQITTDTNYVLWMMLHGAVREEFIFRGVIFGMVRRGRSFAFAAILASACFALSHLGKSLDHAWLVGDWGWTPAVRQILYPFFWGLILAGLYERGGRSLWGPVLIHFGSYSDWLMPGTLPWTTNSLALADWLGEFDTAIQLGAIMLATAWFLPRVSRGRRITGRPAVR